MTYDLVYLSYRRDIRPNILLYMIESAWRSTMVQIMKRRMDWVGALAAFFGAAVVIPSLVVLVITIATVMLRLF